MNLSTWAIHKPVPSLALFLVLCIIGLVSFSRLPVTLYPSVDIPIVTVVVAQPGAASSELTSQVVKPIENRHSQRNRRYTYHCGRVRFRGTVYD